MKRIVMISAILGILLSAGMALAAIKGSADVVKVAAVEESVVGAAGERVAFSIAMDISDTWHVYAHGDTNYIGVDVVLGDEFPLAEFKADYPSGHEGEFFGEPVWMIDGSSKISATALIPEGMESGDYEIPVGVQVQACDDKTCLAPIDLPVTINLTVK
jgi:thiol:disulfide interchange protein DsbD